jgi:DNA uptake protein ComE-like DNA-binding protein
MAMTRKLKRTASLLALAFLTAAAAPSVLPAPAGGELSISGQWNSSIGAVYNIQQNGNQYTWSAPILNQSGTGTISGKVVTISGPGWTVRGTITESDQAGNATKIVGENGVVLFRTMGASAGGAAPSGFPAPSGGQSSISGQWNSSIGAVYNIQQNGNQYTWSAPSLNQSGTGTISGKVVTISGPGWTVRGTITESDQAGNATKIVGENGVVLFRTMSSSAALQVQKLPSLTTNPASVSKININSATAAQLQTIPGITPLLAQKIVGTRPHRSMADLARAGLTKAQIEAVQPYIRVWSPQAKVKFYRMAPGEKINLNTASDLMLAALPGIGRGLANDIVKNRPFARIEDLMKVKGIKEKTFARLKTLIAV